LAILLACRSLGEGWVNLVNIANYTMDIISHLLVGRALAELGNYSPSQITAITLFAALPDAPQIPLYAYVGYKHKRFLDVPKNSDWLREHFRDKHPFWSALWEVPHSLWFLLFVVTPVVIFFKLPLMAAVAYGSHLLADIFTHKGEWAVKIFYPFKKKIHGYTNGWAWNIQSMLALWVILLFIIWLLSKLHAH
jgi:membrane-bound metal-dependent hydrolase YbcI (DUF457 family)